jgi:hypothetical protein
MRALGLPYWGVLLGVATGCTPRAVPDPKPVVEKYAAASRRGDANAVYALLTRDAQRQLGRERVTQILSDSKQELAEQSKGVTSERAEIATRATVRFVDGEMATLSVDEGRFRIASASALPAQASTPEQALAELRTVLMRRSYPGLVRVLTKETAHGFETKLDSLVEALDEADALEIQVDGDRAVVEAPNGHHIELERESGVWKIRNFE